ncbi:MAG TPA: hypothetical protein VFZ25_09895 [Chloroflexota bacterium]|nr:hypothetical protein [Chloroflexota bacterium]
MPKKRLSKSSLLWFIRSRSYVSIPDIRRRFNLESGEDVSAIVGLNGRLFVGLPSDAARVLGDLVREGRVGLETEPGLLARAVVGAYVIPQGQHAHEQPDEEAESPTGPGAGDESAIFH